MTKRFSGGSWTPSFYGYDGGGSVRQLTNAAGAVTDSYEYDAFGNSFTVSGSTPNNFLYRGEAYDSDLGLYYLRARYYNPETGRFMSVDPDDHSPISPIDLHKYLYAGGDPVNWIDPSGRDDEVEVNLTTDLESEQSNAELEAFRKRVECILNTAADALQVVNTSGATVAELAVNFAVCAVQAGYGENPNRELSFGKTGP